jgi:hypothetical protein
MSGSPELCSKRTRLPMRLRARSFRSRQQCRDVLYLSRALLEQRLGYFNAKTPDATW